MRRIVTRQDVEEMLTRWEKGKLSAHQVYDWANDRFCTSNWTADSEVSNEVLALLDTMDINLVVIADIPILRVALASSTLEDACAVLEKRLPDHALEARMRECSDDPFYTSARA